MNTQPRFSYNLPERYLRLSNDVLKNIARLTMLIDHIAYALIYVDVLRDVEVITKGSDLYRLYMIYRIMRGIGRTAFPIFCFLLVEGFYHTRSRKRYALNLFIFALLSEIPFDLAFSRKVFDWSYQNVYWTLLLGLLAIWVCDTYKEKKWIGFLTLLLMCILAYFGKTDYSVQGVTLVYLFYLLRDFRVPQVFFGACVLYDEIPWVIPGYLLLLFYNGERKIRGNAKYFFYVYYPAHLLLLYLCSILLHNRV